MCCTNATSVSIAASCSSYFMKCVFLQAARQGQSLFHLCSSQHYYSHSLLQNFHMQNIPRPWFPPNASSGTIRSSWNHNFQTCYILSTYSHIFHKAPHYIIIFSSSNIFVWPVPYTTSGFLNAILQSAIATSGAKIANWPFSSDQPTLFLSNSSKLIYTYHLQP